MLKAKFIVNQVKTHPDGAYEIVDLWPVYAEDGPNKSWSESTPSGYMQMTISNKGAHGLLKEGQEYLLTFEEA